MEPNSIDLQTTEELQELFRKSIFTIDKFRTPER